MKLALQVDELKEELARVKGERDAYKAVALAKGDGCGCGTGGTGNTPWQAPVPSYPYTQPQVWCNGNTNGVTQL